MGDLGRYQAEDLERRAEKDGRAEITVRRTPQKDAAAKEESPAELGAAFWDRRLSQPFPGAARRWRRKQLPTPPTPHAPDQREAGSRVETPTRRWSRTSYSSRAPWSPRSAHCPSPGSGWAAPRSQSAGLEESPWLRSPNTTRGPARRCRRGNRDRTFRL